MRLGDLENLQKLLTRQGKSAKNNMLNVLKPVIKHSKKVRMQKRGGRPRRMPERPRRMPERPKRMLKIMQTTTLEIQVGAASRKVHHFP